MTNSETDDPVAPETEPLAGAEPVRGSRGAQNADQTILQVGARIRTLRSRQALTLKDVAERTGVSVSMLSMLERGVASASVGTLVSVASALGVHMADLFDHPEGDEASPVKRKDEQAVLSTSEGTTRRVAHEDPTSGIELAVNEYAAGSASGLLATHHGGREFGVVVQGRLVVEVGGEEYALEPGDAVHYASTRPHRIRNDSDELAIAVWVNVDQ